MSTDYFSEHEVHTEPPALPSPSDTPYHTPIPASRRSSRFGTPSTRTSPSPPPMPADAEAAISPFDPRRFTPTLHANLVSEILSLRRDLDSKHKYIEDLETTLHDSKGENESLQKDLSEGTRENRILKEELKHLEKGTLGALDTLAKERDDFKQANDDLTVKLETAQRRFKSQEEDSDRIHAEWAKEKDQWDGERRTLDLRIHATEARLKIVLDEYAALQSELEQPADSGMDGEGLDSGLGNDSDSGSIQSRSNSRNGRASRMSRHARNLSNSSHRSVGRPYRFSTMGSNGWDHGNKGNGMSLADELRFDEEEEELHDLELDSDDFPEHEMRARRALESRQSTEQDEKARRILGLAGEGRLPRSDSVDLDTARSLESGVSLTDSKLDTDSRKSIDTITLRGSRDFHQKFRAPSTVYEDPPMLVKESPKVEYVDTGIQYSPPNSPVRARSQASSHSDRANGLVKNLAEMYEVEANQRRKRISAVAAPFARTSTPDKLKEVPSPVMVSAAVQTVEQQPISPPATPKAEPVQRPLTPPSPPKVETCSTWTQTEAPEPTIVVEDPRRQLSIRAPPPAPIIVPSIIISPTLSAPNSPRQAILPQYTKNAECQTTYTTANAEAQTDTLRSDAHQSSFSAMRPTANAEVQTESVRSDARLAKLPPHLLPSAIRSKPGTPEPLEDDAEEPQARTTSPSKSGPIVTNIRMYKDDDFASHRESIVSRNVREEVKRPVRSSSLFASFANSLSDDDDDREIEFSDDEYDQTAYSARALKHKRPFGSPPTPVPEEVEPSSRPTSDASLRPRPNGNLSRQNSSEKPAKVAKPQHPGPVRRRSSIRRSALIQSGTVAHQQRSRSPSLTEMTADELRQYMAAKPPFPVPTRSSSRRLPFSKSEGSASPTRRPGAATHGRTAGSKRHIRQDSLRKVRSAAVMPRTARRRSRSPPLPSPSIDSSQMPPPMPQDLVSSPTTYAPTFAIPGDAFSHGQQRSINTSYTAGSHGSSVQSVTVVDAIAATMVGEWMFKYVRRRKSFGVPDSPMDAAQDPNGVRHKRWVWLSPYERSVMWSSKQPTTGTALLGKNGRKLTIQNVLDVADNSAPPKGADQQIFNRSILILTPARALKFTATSRERHYLWLTALSFLAHSSNVTHEAEAVPPPIPTRDPPQIPAEVITGSFRRAPLNDSIRLSKDRGQAIRQRNMAKHSEPIHEYHVTEVDRPVPESASPPNVPRFAHSRKRSSTGPSVPAPNVYRNFSHSALPSPRSVASSDFYNYPPSVPSEVYNPPSVSTSARQSEVSNAARPNFFEAMGTMRMEAFVADTTKQYRDDVSQNSGTGSWGRSSRVPGRRRASQWSNSTNDAHREGAHKEFGDFPDPFRGF